MKNITKEEAQALIVTNKRGQHPENPVITESMKLKVGEYLLVEKKDWHIKSLVSQALRDSSPVRHARAKFKVKQLSDKSGWIVKRIC